MSRDCDAVEEMSARFSKALKRALIAILIFWGWVEFVDYCDKF